MTVSKRGAYSKRILSRIMSVPSHYVQRHTSVESKEDCRDYLRTGRCKYGPSCKYNHPANVQSGGGVKGPLDPSEPLFPLRPNEPVCQYYMKHGTCKFGQACKFNHPPPSSLPNSGRINGNPMIMNGGAKNDMHWNPGNESGVPMLPQRPDEPNCIYFLKNGRCKYGSTCRYHHPLNYHDRKHGGVADDGRGHLTQPNQGHGDSSMQPKLHYVSLPPGTYQQGHFVVADGQLAFLSLDGSSQGQVISVAPPQNGNQDGPMVFTSSKPSPLSREVGSSTSSTSIASSYESSNIGSGGSLNTFNIVEPSPHGRAQMVPPGRAGFMQNHGPETSLPRVVSTSDGSDGSTMYYDASSARSARSISSSGQSGPGGNTGQWRGQRSSSFDHTRQTMPTTGEDGIHESASVPSFGSAQDDQGHGRGYRQLDSQRGLMSRGRPTQGTRPRKTRQNGAEVDDGLSMMTSALLTMLDTPEEAAADYYQDYDDPRGQASQSSTPLMGNQYSSRKDLRNTHINSYNDHAVQYVPQPGAYYEQDNSIGMPVNHYDGTYSHEQDGEQVQRWSPTWHGTEHHIGGSLPQPSQSISPQRTSRDTSNVGLYLP